MVEVPVVLAYPSSHLKGLIVLIVKVFTLQLVHSALVFRRLSDGVMVAQSPLEALVMVRIHVGQPVAPELGFIRKIPRVLRLDTADCRQPPGV